MLSHKSLEILKTFYSFKQKTKPSNNCRDRAGETALQEKTLIAESDDLSVIPEHVVERADS